MLVGQALDADLALLAEVLPGIEGALLARFDEAAGFDVPGATATDEMPAKGAE